MAIVKRSTKATPAKKARVITCKPNKIINKPVLLKGTHSKQLVGTFCNLYLPTIETKIKSKS